MSVGSHINYLQTQQIQHSHQQHTNISTTDKHNKYSIHINNIQTYRLLTNTTNTAFTPATYKHINYLQTQQIQH